MIAPDSAPCSKCSTAPVWCRAGFVESAYYEGDKGRYCGPGLRKRCSVSVMRNGVSTCPDLISAPRDRPAAFGADHRASGDRAPLPLQRRPVRSPHLHRTFRRATGSMGASHGEAWLHPLSPRSGAWPADAAGEQRHTPARFAAGLTHWLTSSRLSTLILGASRRNHRYAASSASWKGAGRQAVAGESPRPAKPGWLMWRSCGNCPAARGTGCRSLMENASRAFLRNWRDSDRYQIARPNACTNCG